MAITPKANRRWIQFSLRTLFALITACAVLFGWVSWRVKQARDQERAVAAIEAVGGRVSYDMNMDWESNVLEVKAPGRSRVQEWLHRLLGVDVFADVEWVHGGFAGSAWRTNLSDIDLAHLAAIPRLRGLDLELQKNLSDVGMANLRGLKKLEVLHLDNVNITDDGMVYVGSLVNLRSLSLFGTKVSDAGLEHLRDLTSLRVLSLGDTQISDEGLVHLRELKQVDTLDLRNTIVTDAGLPHLAGLTALKLLNLDYTQVTAEGVQKLQKALPKCSIWH